MNEDYLDEVIQKFLDFDPSKSTADVDTLILLGTEMYGLRAVLLSKMRDTYLRACKLAPGDFLPYLRLAKLSLFSFNDREKAFEYLSMAKQNLKPDEPHYDEYMDEIRLIEHPPQF